MTRSIHLTIAPATATTCGDGSGQFCPMLRYARFGAEERCAIFHIGEDLEAPAGWLLRWPECIAAEVKE